MKKIVVILVFALICSVALGLLPVAASQGTVSAGSQPTATAIGTQQLQVSAPSYDYYFRDYSRNTRLYVNVYYKMIRFTASGYDSGWVYATGWTRSGDTIRITRMAPNTWMSFTANTQMYSCCGNVAVCPYGSWQSYSLFVSGGVD